MTEQYSKMLDMLEQSTQKGLLTWSRGVSGSIFYTMVNGCQIDVEASYDVNLKDHITRLRLYNADGEVFSRQFFMKNFDVDDYERVFRLYTLVKDKYYKVTESENLIMTGLDQLLNKE